MAGGRGGGRGMGDSFIGANRFNSLPVWHEGPACTAGRGKGVTLRERALRFSVGEHTG